MKRVYTLGGHEFGFDQYLHQKAVSSDSSITRPSFAMNSGSERERHTAW
jgi:hypothetical protein